MNQAVLENHIIGKIFLFQNGKIDNYEILKDEIREIISAHFGEINNQSNKEVNKNGI